jgi:hypothetical protein
MRSAQTNAASSPSLEKLAATNEQARLGRLLAKSLGSAKRKRRAA